ncbi:LAETG motif-containing sortase-dependent surface protein [Streptomyces sp. NP-1717]|uniref:LAETG motif-containing sortase-dependent surface protein n=1 Tax=Streptomyces sp. NP-1717 TaxID=2704470 RepID=UPI001F5CBB53|nr:LAETG motif-containing sortase-dependent surface protein [Streptomyces sp. NP-1717]MCI3222580.1 LPXTG cell wall anchor domain-containing protein [Streptomyces sp. NP-1717]
MPTPPYRRRVSRSAVATLGAAGLVALGAAPAAVGDEAPPSLALGDIKPITGVKPGSPVDLPVTVVNNGTTTVDKVWIKYTATRGLAFPEVPSNCVKQYVGAYDEMPERWIAICAFDQAVKPGVAYKPQKPFAVKAEKHAFDDEMWVGVTDYEPSPDENSTPVPGTAPEIELIESPAGGTGSADRFRVPVTSVNTADYEVTGAALRGKPGDTVTMKVTFTNTGPGWVWSKPGTPWTSVLVTLPAGTSVVKPDFYCKVKGKVYDCGLTTRPQEHLETATFTFKLKIDKKVAGAKGSVALSNRKLPFDPDKSNDTAPITLEVTGGEPGGTGGTAGGSDGGSGSTGGSSGGSTGSTGGSSGGSTGSTGGSSSTGGAGTATTGGNLAATGSSSATLPIAGAAAAAVVMGAGTVLVVRRRRARHDSDGFS